MMMKLLDLPDDVLVMIAIRLPTVDFIHFRSTNKKLWKILSTKSSKSSSSSSSSSLWNTLLQIRDITVDSPYKQMIRSMEQLYLFEQIQAAKLLQENRIGFGFGTFHNFNNSTDIKGSRERIETVKALLKKNQQLTVTLDVHCGIAGAPSDFVANQFSQTRGQAALEAFADLSATTTTTQQQNEETSGYTTSTTSTTRVFMKAWGKRAAQVAANSNHPVFGALAKQGKGWAEIRFGMLLQRDNNNNNGGDTNDDEEELFQIPPRPAFYEGLTPEEDIVAAEEEEEEEDIAGVWWVLEEEDVE